ncbi:acylphosphatase [archaeon]|nr:acylphosphatase [archaeon]
MQTRVIIKVNGNVQGVFFRQYAKQIADKLRIKGVAKNLLDGSVEIIAEGEEEDLRTLVRACEEGPKGAIIENTHVYYDKSTGEFTSFRVSF